MAKKPEVTIKKEVRYSVADAKGYRLGVIEKRDTMPIVWVFSPNSSFNINSKQLRAVSDCLDSLNELDGPGVGLTDDASILLHDLKNTERQLAETTEALAFYQRRVEALQKAQLKMRDPERKVVCDILANGKPAVLKNGRMREICD